MVKQLTSRFDRRRPPGEAGYSLIEMIVALTIIGVVAALAVPFVSSSLPGLALKDSAQQLAEATRDARRQALTRSRESWIELDIALGAYRSQSSDWRSLPDATDLSFVAAAQERTGPDRARIRFYPDGGATGGTVTLAKSGLRAVVQVDWLTGTTSVSTVEGDG